MRVFQALGEMLLRPPLRDICCRNDYNLRSSGDSPSEFAITMKHTFSSRSERDVFENGLSLFFSLSLLDRTFVDVFRSSSDRRFTQKCNRLDRMRNSVP